MGKAFVAKLARQGARNPEALAAWIGRHKHGKAAFQRLAQAGRDDAKEQRGIMTRVRPFGRLSRDLTGLSDRDLGRALRELSAQDSARVAVEMDRRDTAARLPGARADLIGLSDEELGQRAGSASGSELAAIAEESDRRQKLGEVFPDGSLADDLSGMDEDTLGWALRYAQPDEASRIAVEMDRRHPLRHRRLRPGQAPLPVSSQTGLRWTSFLGPIQTGGRTWPTMFPTALRGCRARSDGLPNGKLKPSPPGVPTPAARFARCTASTSTPSS